MRNLLRAVSLLCAAGWISSVHAQPLTSPVSVPLINTRDHLLIEIALGSNTHAYPYVFDTGSILFATACGRGPSWAGATYTQTPPGNTFRISYGNGNLSYMGQIATSTLTFAPRADTGNSLVVSNATVGIITRSPRIYPNWNADIDSTPAIAPENTRTFGTFGAGLFQGKGSVASFGSVLGQIPVAGGLDQGFIIHSGGADSRSGKVTIGLSQEEVDQFPILVRMQPSTGTGTATTGQTTRYYPENQIRGLITLENRYGRRYGARVLVCADTGGLGLHLIRTRAGVNEFRPPDEFINDEGNLRDGIRFSLILPRAEGKHGLCWSFITGQRLYLNRVHVGRGRAVGSFNPGIALFHRFDVMFDLTRGLMGFRPVDQ